MKKKQLTGKILRMITAAAGSLTILLPLYFIVINSLKTSSEAGELNFALPQVFQWKNYIDVIQAGSLVRAFGNSMLMAGVSVVICLIVSAMAAFSISRDRNRLNKGLYNYFFLGLIAPVNYVATIFVLKALHIQNTFIGIILVHAALGIPFLIFLFDSFIGGIPRELDEAAVIDGAGPLGLFFKVILPLLKPVTITGLVLNFLGAWNDFITPLYLLNDTKKLGMINSIYNFFGEHFNEWNMIFADILLTVAPIMILYIFGQKYIVSGTTAGAVKG